MDENELKNWIQQSPTKNDMDALILILVAAIKVNILKYKQSYCLTIQSYNNPDDDKNSIVVDWDWQTISVNTLGRDDFFQDAARTIIERFPSCDIMLIEKQNSFCCIGGNLPYILVQYKEKPIDNTNI